MDSALVIAPNWIGDAVMAQPLLRQIHATGTRVTVVAPSSVCAVFEAMPEVAEVLPTQLAHGKLQWGARRRFGQSLRARNFAVAYVLPNSWKSALIPLFAKIPVRIGYRGELRYGLLTKALRDPNSKQTMVARYAALGPQPDSNTVQTEPLLTVSPQIAAQTRARFGIAPEAALYALCPGAEYGPAKRWPSSHFAAVATRLSALPGTPRVVVVGGPGDLALAEEVARLSLGRCTVLAGQTSLAEAIALLATATAVISNDSGLMHIAAALARPQVAIFGSSDPRHTPPLSRRAEVLWLHLDCSPCFARVCPLGHTRCLHDISADEVYAALNDSLAKS